MTSPFTKYSLSHFLPSFSFPLFRIWFYSYSIAQSSPKHSFYTLTLLCLCSWSSILLQCPSHSSLTNFYLLFTAFFKCYLPLNPSPKQNLPLLSHHFLMTFYVFHHGTPLQFSAGCVHVCFSTRQKDSWDSFIHLFSPIVS